MITATVHVEINDGGEDPRSMDTGGHCGYCYSGFPMLCAHDRDADDGIWAARERVLDDLEEELASDEDQFVASDEEVRLALDEMEPDTSCHCGHPDCGAC